MIPVKQIDPDDLALYAMQILPPDEAAELALLLRHGSEARRVLAEIQGDLALYALTAEMREPPAQARQRLMQQVAEEKRTPPEDFYHSRGADAPSSSRSLFDEEPPPRNPMTTVLGWAGWVLAAGMAVEMGILYHQREQLRSAMATQTEEVVTRSSGAERASRVIETVEDPATVRATLSAADHLEPQGEVSYLPGSGSLVFLAEGLAPLHTGITYELWLIPANGGTPLPAGTFQPDMHGSAHVLLPDLPKSIAAQAFDVTIESAGGATSPTLPFILKGTSYRSRGDVGE
ncbi:anti-sigma factor [Granulicella sp. WH15]|uniref:anti-sigma factor n=1 Tax=Granulicella sp. WH15 TaxID=2602070 RepID=UPI0013669830|nr:anti-sigma factor [Granulicella sp. WH15]QHN03363.1 anti-sigma factor [Granulicella sp. WH15]